MDRRVLGEDQIDKNGQIIVNKSMLLFLSSNFFFDLFEGREGRTQEQ